MSVEKESVLFANERFYAAFNSKDMGAMRKLWSTERIVCAHPGWLPIFGREEVMASWEAILAEPSNPQIQNKSAEASIYGDYAIVICIECVGDSNLCATNSFMKVDGDWKLFHHHAGPVKVQEGDLPDDTDTIIN